MTICIRCPNKSTQKYNQLAPMCEIHYQEIIKTVNTIRNNMKPSKEISKYMSKLGKLSRKKHPFPKEYYKKIRAIGVAKQKKEKLSPPSLA